MITPTRADRLRVRRPSRVPAWWRDLQGLGVWATTLVVVALWVSGGGLRELDTTAALLTSTGRLTGLVATDLLLVQVLLMARVPWVERSVGRDELVRGHRLAGFASFVLMIAHAVLISVGYAMTDRTGLLREVWDLVTTYPGMLPATAGTAALALVVITSVRLARRRFRYEAWHLLHLYAYLGVGSALPHQLWTGADFTSSTAATVFWWSAYAGALGALLVFRVGWPLWRSLRHRLVVDHVRAEGPGVVSVVLRGRRLDRLPVAAGQFFVWRFLDGPGWTRGHPFSLSAAPDGRRLRITAKDLGAGSLRLAAVPAGTRVLIEGPYGAITDSVRKAPKVAMFASGIGITPLRALLEEMPYRPGDAVLCYRASTPAQLVLRRELDTLAARRGARVLYLPGRRAWDRASWLPAGYGTTTDEVALRQFVPDIAEHEVFVCGPGAWTDAVIACVRRAGVPAAQVHSERFGW
ncbi:ferredoxin reductase family protein [Amycolatopsis sp. NPDC051106]|uniref:ferredoxin reductase family protein n=1 Tax=unclassified Amycolatopsis TaxID=2618356 RepID=UPI003442EED6